MVKIAWIYGHQFWRWCIDRQTDTLPIAKSRCNIAERDNKTVVIVRSVVVQRAVPSVLLAGYFHWELAPRGAGSEAWKTESEGSLEKGIDPVSTSLKIWDSIVKCPLGFRMEPEGHRSFYLFRTRPVVALRMVFDGGWSIPALQGLDSAWSKTHIISVGHWILSSVRSCVDDYVCPVHASF